MYLTQKKFLSRGWEYSENIWLKFNIFSSAIKFAGVLLCGYCHPIISKNSYYFCSSIFWENLIHISIDVFYPKIFMQWYCVIIASTLFFLLSHNTDVRY